MDGRLIADWRARPARRIARSSIGARMTRSRWPATTNDAGDEAVVASSRS